MKMKDSFFRVLPGIVLALGWLAGRAGAVEPVLPLKHADLRHAVLAWQAQGGAKAEVKQDGGAFACTMTLSRPSAAVWNAHLAVEDWSDRGTMTLEFAEGDPARLAVGLRDIYGAAAACAFDVPGKGGPVKVPLSDFHLQGLCLRYVKSIAFWNAQGQARTVSLRSLGLAAEGFDRSWPRAAMTLLDPNARDARMSFNYTKDWVKLSPEHAAPGRKCFLCQAPKGKWLNIYGIVQHDWRNFNRLAMDLYLPGDKDATLRMTVRDAWVKGFGNGVTADAEVPLRPGANAVSIPLNAFNVRAIATVPASGPAAGAKPVVWEYVHQIGWELVGWPAAQTFYLDNVRLEGDGKLPDALAAARKDMPSWGYDLLEKVDVPGEFAKIDIPAPGDKTSLEVGAAKVKVTPALGSPMSEGRSAEGVLDDLYIRAALMKDGQRQVLMLSLDTLYFPNMPEATAAAGQAAGIPSQDVYCCATHNHNAAQPYASKEFTRQIIDAAAQAATLARKQLKPVRMGVARTTCDANYNRNQTLPDQNGYFSVLDHRFLDKSMDSQPACKELGAVAFTDEAGRPVATIVNYSAHNNMMCRLTSRLCADWAGWTSRLVEQKTGGICLTVPGAFGNTNMRRFNVDWSCTIEAGRDVAAEALAALADPKALAGVNVRDSGSVGMFALSGQGSPLPGKTEPHELRVRALRIGPAVFVDPGGELFTEYGIDVKKRAALPYVFFSFSAGYYFPTRESFKAGGYGTKDRKEDWGEVVSATALKLIQAIADGTAAPATQP